MSQIDSRRPHSACPRNGRPQSTCPLLGSACPRKCRKCTCPRKSKHPPPEETSQCLSSPRETSTSSLSFRAQAAPPAAEKTTSDSGLYLIRRMTRDVPRNPEGLEPVPTPSQGRTNGKRCLLAFLSAVLCLLLFARSTRLTPKLSVNRPVTAGGRTSANPRPHRGQRRLLGRCTGSVDCRVCSSCSSCHHCQSGGSCGVCQTADVGR